MLLDIPIRLGEQVLVLVQLVLEQGLAQGLFDLALTGAGGLPIRKTHVAHDLVDVGDDTLYDDGGVLVAGFFE
jgi:hypothetical protein